MKEKRSEGAKEKKTALWAGRFTEATQPLVQNYTRSIHFDKRLAPFDIKGSQAHVRMLNRQGILSDEDAGAILKGLGQIQAEIESGEFPFRDELEDIHMNIEFRLKELIGEPGGKLHTGRSRNDQVATDLRLYCRHVADCWKSVLRQLVEVLVTRAEEHRLDLFPAWTHLQAAQPLSWAQYFLAFAEMAGRDSERLDSLLQRHSVSPLGAGALSGSSIPLDPDYTAAELGFSEAFWNSYDVVGDRDMVLELAQAGTQIMLHFSRLAEDFIYLSSTPVAWLELPDSLCTGSSMMPQKKNPDVLELMRGKTASVVGHLNALLVLVKGLPSSYHRDLQQDKEHLFPIVDIVSDSLEILVVLLAQAKVRVDRAHRALESDFLMATELAEWLVKQGLPFRTAHEKVGALVAFCVARQIGLKDLTAEMMAEVIPEVGFEGSQVFDPGIVLEGRTHRGSTGLEPIEQQLRKWKRWLAE
ncbi:MAG: argininosuccinate lyase [Acidobacteriota bacterium]|nr:MAG: argininosuccinate lyase [Acidobacteriota bacterium]